MRTEFQEISWCETRMGPGCSISLRAYRWGDGGPRCCLVCGMHGDEYTPHYVVREYLRAGSPTSNCGTLDIIPAANWAGMLMGIRDYPFCGVDLNRGFAADHGCEHLGEVTHRLVEFLRTAQLVIDLHNWDTPTLLVGISYESPPGNLPGGPAWRALRHFGCDYVWVPSEEKYAHTLGASLSRLRTPYCAIELPPPWLVSGALITDYAHRLGKAIAFAEPEESPQVLWGDRTVLHAPTSGLFAPSVSPGDAVTAGTLVGEVFSPLDPLMGERIESCASGMVLHVEERTLVRENAPVCFIGTASSSVGNSGGAGSRPCQP